MLIESRFPGPWLTFCMLEWATLSLSHCLSFPLWGDTLEMKPWYQKLLKELLHGDQLLSRAVERCWQLAMMVNATLINPGGGGHHVEARGTSAVSRTEARTRGTTHSPFTHSVPCLAETCSKLGSQGKTLLVGRSLMKYCYVERDKNISKLSLSGTGIRKSPEVHLRNP